jgi:hypothetical protein
VASDLDFDFLVYCKRRPVDDRLDVREWSHPTGVRVVPSDWRATPRRAGSATSVAVALKLPISGRRGLRVCPHSSIEAGSEEAVNDPFDSHIRVATMIEPFRRSSPVGLRPRRRCIGRGTAAGEAIGRVGTIAH